MKRVPPQVAIPAAAVLLVVATVVAAATSKTGLARVTFDLHLPRALLGAAAGCGLAACGVVLQAVLRNPLASPYTLGIASGAAVGAAGMIHLGDLGLLAMLPGALALPSTYLGALLGALATAAFVYSVAASRGLGAETLLLAGVAVALFSGAVVTVLQFQADTIDLYAIVRWSMGNLSDVQYRRLWLSLPFLAAGAVLMVWVARSLDVASLDDDSARGLGVDPVAVRRWAFVGTSLVITGVVAAAGPIGFVGLIVPHAVRAIVGPDPRVLLPTAALTGGAFLVACDAVARMLFYPTDLPINVITSAIGCPAFIWILLRRSA